MLGIFGKKDDEAQKRLQLARASGAFESKASIFDYLAFVEGMEMDEAEQMANRIAAIRGVPDVIAQPKKGTDLYIERAEMFLSLGDKYPWIQGLIVSVASAAIGAGAGFFLGKESEEEHHHTSQPNIYNNYNGESENI